MSKLKFIIAILALYSFEALGQSKEFEPIFEPNFKVGIVDLLEISALEVDIDKISGRKKAKKQYKKVSKDVENLTPEKQPKLSKLRNAYRRAASVLHYYSVNSHFSSSESRRANLRTWLKQLAGTYAELSKDPATSKLAAFYVQIATFGEERGQGSAVPSLLALKSDLKNNKAIQSNIDLMVGYSMILASATADQGKNYLKRAPSSSVFGRIAHRLTLAMYESGISSDGERLRDPDPKYKKSLSYVVKVARGAPKGVQSLVSNTSFFIWSAVNQGLNGALPFDINGMDGLYPVDAYNENNAIRMIQSKNFSKALEVYGKIAIEYKGKSTAIKLDRRIWELEKLQYRSSLRTEGLRLGFKKIHTSYGKSKKKSAKSLYRDGFRDYRTIVFELLSNAAKTKSNANQAISEALHFLKYYKTRKESYPLRARLAIVYRKNSMFEKAVTAYLDLAKDAPGKNHLLAIEAQSNLASWPKDPPWRGVKPGDQKARLKLLTLYDKLLKLNSKKVSWKVLAHIGLIHRALGQGKSAENIWLKHLQKEVKPNPHVSEAAGLLFTEYFNSKRWVNLVDLTFLSMKKKVAMTQGFKPINFQQSFSTALFTQGQNDLKNGKYNRCTKYLSDFVKLFKSDGRVPIAYHTLGRAYKNLGKTGQALKSFKILVDKYPAYQDRKTVILEGGQWAASDKKTLEFAFFFYGKYLTDYKNEANVPAVRRTLAELYMSRKLYGWATRLYREQSLSPAVSPQWQLEAALKYLETEQKFGKLEDAVFGANRILQLAKPDSDAAGKAFGFLANYASSRNDVKGMLALEPKLKSISKRSPSAREALGKMKFKLAQIFTKPIQNNEANAFIKDPEAAIKSYYDKFLVEKRHYESVCQIGITQSCAPSQLKLVLLAQSTMQAINSVDIASTLGETRVNAFNVFKQLHMSKLEEAAKNYAQTSLKLARDGTTTPIWKTEIIKSLGNKTSFGIAH